MLASTCIGADKTAARLNPCDDLAHAKPGAFGAPPESKRSAAANLDFDLFGPEKHDPPVPPHDDRIAAGLVPRERLTHGFPGSRY